MREQFPTSTTTTPRAGLYVRVSTRGQEDDGSSLDTQAAACRAYAVEHGYHVVDVYFDTHTGSQYRERPALTQLRDALRRELDVACGRFTASPDMNAPA